MSIEIRGRQDQLQVHIHNLHWQHSMDELQVKLSSICDLHVEVIYVFMEYEMSKDELKSLFSLVNQLGMCIGSICYFHQNKMLETLDTIGIGNYKFDHDVLILNDVSMHTSITMYHGNLYVFGCVSGEVEFYSKMSKLYAVSIEKLRIQMNDMPMQYIEKRDHCVLQYEKRKETKLWKDQL